MVFFLFFFYHGNSSSFDFSMRRDFSPSRELPHVNFVGCANNMKNELAVKISSKEFAQVRDYDTFLTN